MTLTNGQNGRPLGKGEESLLGSQSGANDFLASTGLLPAMCPGHRPRGSMQSSIIPWLSRLRTRNSRMSW